MTTQRQILNCLYIEQNKVFIIAYCFYFEELNNNFYLVNF